MNDQGGALDPQQVVVGLSGGVDSAVAALLLQQAGYTVRGVALDTWRAGSESEEAGALASQVARHLDITLVRRDLEATFYQRVVAPFLEAYVGGETPNPCVFCNPTLKFATLLEEADAVGARWIATGHYARISCADDGLCRLRQGCASAKDQSYALYRLTQPVLQRLKLPLGDLPDKEGVREIARRHGLPSADTDDSQDLCFAVGTSYQNLVTALRPESVRPGPIRDEAGKRLGEHQGLPLYTVGQRSGLGISASERLYVVALDAAENALVVGPRESLARDHCRVRQVTFIAGRPPGQGDAASFDAHARIRYRVNPVQAKVEMTGPTTAIVHFSEPQYGVAPGQSLVLYREAEVLGGGLISNSLEKEIDRARIL